MKIRQVEFVCSMFAVAVLALTMLALGGCGRQSGGSAQRVTLYCSVDDVYARQVLKLVEFKTGLQVDALYDTEATKTAGLATRIRAEAAHPRGDVFWSSALLQTLLLKREGLLQAYTTGSARDIPAAFKDKDGYWTGVGARARALVYYRPATGPAAFATQPPHALGTLLLPSLNGKIGISNPQFGTASDWVAALAVRQGKERTLAYFRALKKNGVQVLPGNSVVADRVANGDLLAGITDTDDYFAQRRKTGTLDAGAAAPLAQRRIDTILVPGSVAILKGAPHQAAAQRLVDALASADVERELAKFMVGVIPLRELHSGDLKRLDPALSSSETAFALQAAPDDTAKWPAAWDGVRDPLAQILELG